MAIKSRKEDFSDGFDVTVKRVIGRVSFGAGTDDPHVAAFKLIGECGEPGEFSFPHESGATWNVSVGITEPDSTRNRV